MKLLLDTHVFLWWDLEPLRLSPEARAACSDPSNSLHLSIASIWEIQIKLQLNKLTLRLRLEDVLEEQQRNGLRIETVTVDDVLGLANLPPIHRDPFDRLLIAQAWRGGYHLVGNDPLVARYDVAILW